MSRAKDELGNKYGKLTVIKRAENIGTAAAWECLCECGGTKIVRGSHLRSGQVKSCGCIPFKRTFEDYTGKKFGRLTVIKLHSVDKHRNRVWECECECGNKVNVIGNDLYRGHTKSCGCLQKERTSEAHRKDLTGQQFGRLTAIKDIGSRNNKRLWLCKCECGNEIEVPSNDLVTNNTSSCGCIKSKGEEKIQKILDEYGIIYKREHTFKDLRGVGGGLLRFDFAIFSPEGKLYCLIEYDGIQHFDEDNYFFSKSTQQHDQMKNDYCVKNNIILKRINKDTDIEKTLQSILTSLNSV